MNTLTRAERELAGVPVAKELMRRARRHWWYGREAPPREHREVARSLIGDGRVVVVALTLDAGAHVQRIAPLDTNPRCWHLTLSYPVNTRPVPGIVDSQLMSQAVTPGEAAAWGRVFFGDHLALAWLDVGVLPRYVDLRLFLEPSREVPTSPVLMVREASVVGPPTRFRQWDPGPEGFAFPDGPPAPKRRIHRGRGGRT